MNTRFVLYLLLLSYAADAQSWNWIRVFGGNHADYGSKVILQQDGSILMTALFKSGMFQMDSIAVVNGGGWGSIIAKFDQEGNRQSLVTGVVSGNINGNPNNTPYLGTGFLGISNANTVYVPISAEALWGMLDTITIQPWGHIAEFNSAGRCIRAKRCGDGFRCAKTIGNSVYVQGGYTGNAGSIGTFLLNDPYPSAMTSKATIGKLDNNLNAQWAKQVLGGKQTNLNLLETSDNHLYFLVNSDSCVLFDTMQLCSPPGIPSWAVVKADTNGNVKWYRSVSCAKFTFDVMSNTVDASGNSYTTCLYDTSVSFCGQTITKSAGGGYDSYLAKVNSNGVMQWISVMKSNGYIGVNASHTDAVGNTYLSGQYSGQCIFGTDTITSTGTEDFYITRFDSSGACMGVVTYYGVSPSGICQDSAGNFILVGSTLGFKYKDSIYITNYLPDIFIGKHTAITGIRPPKTRASDSELYIYANPNKGFFTVDIPSEFYDGKAQLRIYNNDGQIIKDEEIEITDNRMSVDLGSVSRGLYTVELQRSIRRFTGRVVVE